MRRMSILVLCVCVIASAAMAQPATDGITRGYLVKPKRGMEAKFEEAYKQHVEWHRQQNDDWTWDTWQYETGDLIGQYVIMSGGHNWEDFDSKDEFAKKDNAHFMSTVAQYVESESGWYSRTRYDLSHLPESDPGTMPLARVTEFELHLGKGADFNRYMEKSLAARKKTNRRGYYVLIQGVSGTDGPTRTIVGLRKDWAGFKPNDTTSRDMMEEVYGKSEADALRETFWNSVKSIKSNFVRYRADLSYKPSTT